MRTFTWMITACAGALLALLLTGGSASYAQSEVYGTMMVVKGDIKVTSAKSGKVEAAKVGFKVYAGDAIQSGADSRAKIIMSDKNVINVSPDSKVTIAKYENNPTKDSRNVELKVDYGKVRASVEQNYDGEKNKFNIRTPTAVAGVRGTDFIAGFNSQTRRTTVVTFTGVVAVGTAGPNGRIDNAVFVRPGQTTNVGDGQKAEPPKAVPQDQFNNMNQESSADTAKGPGETPAAAGPATPSAKDQDGGEQQAKNDPAPPPAADGAKQDAPAPAPEGGTPARSTASVPSVSMVDARDLDTGISREIKVAPDLPKAPTTYKPPISAPVVTPTPNPFVDNVIRNQKSRVRVEICLPNTGC